VRCVSYEVDRGRASRAIVDSRVTWEILMGCVAGSNEPRRLRLSHLQAL
jgi:hypothetical protein